MVGLINFGLSNPNAFFQGAKNSSDMLQRIAKARAGSKLAEGDTQGAVDTLNKSGDLEGAKDIQYNIDEKDERAQKMNAAQRQRHTEMIIDAAHVMNQAIKQGGVQSVLPTFEQMVPIFKAHGATDAELAQYRDALTKDPAGFVSHVNAWAQGHMKTYNLKPGDQITTDDGQVLASRKSAPKYMAAGQNRDIVEVPNGDEDPAPTLENQQDETPPDEAFQNLQPGHARKFVNGQSWTIDANGQKTRVQ